MEFRTVLFHSGFHFNDIFCHSFILTHFAGQNFEFVSGIDYDEIFSPVARYDSVRLLLCLAAQFKLKIRQFDVSTAFLNAPIDKEIFMTQPEGLDDGTGRVCKLKKSLYGLCQSPRLWHSTFAQALASIGFKQLEKDQCIFKWSNGQLTSTLIIFVDDGLIMGPDDQILESQINSLKEKFKVATNERHDKFKFIGLEIEMSNNSISISVESKIIALAEKFGLKDAKLIDTPMEVNYDLMDDDQVVPELESIYRQLIGSLNFLAITARPDIAFSVNKLAQFTSKPTQRHFKSLKRVVRYLMKTSDLALVYESREGIAVECYSDSDFASDKNSRKSTSGCITLINDSPVTWFSRKQKCIAQSTCEAEFIASNEATKECIWLRHMLDELEVEYKSPITLKCDNQSTIALINNNSYSNKTKHLDYRLKFTRECINDGWMQLSFTPTERQLADFLTKPLSREKHYEFINQVQRSKNSVKTRVVGTAMSMMTLLTTLLVVNCAGATASFHRESPVIWKMTPREVIKGSMVIHYNIDTHSPCTIFDEMSIRHPGLAVPFGIHKQSCEKLYQQEVVTKLDALYNLHAMMDRHKRSIWQKFGLVTAVAAPVLASPLGLAAVMVVSAVSFGFWTISTVTQLQSDMDTTQNTIEEHEKIIMAIENDLTKLRDTVSNLGNKFSEYTIESARATDITSEITSKITLVGQELTDARAGL